MCHRAKHHSGRTVFFLASSVFALSAFAAAALRAQQPETQSSAQAPIQARAELVRVDVTVTDAHGNFVSGLEGHNFRVLDDGAERPITFFASTETPAEVLVLVETSPAVYLIHQQHLTAAYALLDGLAPDDSVGLAAYDQTPRAVLPLTQDKAAAARALMGLSYGVGMGDLNLYDAISVALDWLAPVPGKKALVLLSTGLDSSPTSHWDALVTKLRASDVTIFSVALGGKLRDFENKKTKTPAPPGATSATADDRELSFEQADRALQTLASITGGFAWFPRRDTDFTVIYRQLATTLRHVYTLGFEPLAHDGRFHSIEVQVFDASGRRLAPADAKTKASCHVHAREGYQAPAQ